MCLILFLDTTSDNTLQQSPGTVEIVVEGKGLKVTQSSLRPLVAATTFTVGN